MEQPDSKVIEGWERTHYVKQVLERYGYCSLCQSACRDMYSLDVFGLCRECNHEVEEWFKSGFEYKQRGICYKCKKNPGFPYISSPYCKTCSQPSRSLHELPPLRETPSHEQLPLLESDPEEEDYDTDDEEVLELTRSS